LRKRLAPAGAECAVSFGRSTTRLTEAYVLEADSAKAFAKTDVLLTASSREIA
jgi:hypothetical protein